LQIKNPMVLILNVEEVVEKKRKNYPKCVPIAKARSMSKGQKASAVKRKQQAGNTGPKPANVPTILKRKKMGAGGLV
jgi:hypothetical protein